MRVPLGARAGTDDVCTVRVTCCSAGTLDESRKLDFSVFMFTFSIFLYILFVMFLLLLSIFILEWHISTYETSCSSEGPVSGFTWTGLLTLFFSKSYGLDFDGCVESHFYVSLLCYSRLSYAKCESCCKSVILVEFLIPASSHVCCGSYLFGMLNSRPAVSQ